MIPARSPALLMLGVIGQLPGQAETPALSPAMTQIAAAYAAKVTASAVFVSGRTVASVRAEEFAPVTALDQLMGPLLKLEVDQETRSVTASLPFVRATATATVDLGCTLVLGAVEAATLRARSSGLPPAGEPIVSYWDGPGALANAPATERPTVDRAALADALDAAFAEPEGGPPRHTRAVVVVYRGLLVAERYAPGYDRDTLLPGWSMTKTLVDALVGIRVRQGKLDLDAPLAVPEWSADDPRRQLRLPDLLGMRSGLRWSESYTDPSSAALRMLFTAVDHGGLQASQPLAAPPGERFTYSSGSTNLICRLLRTTFDSDADYWSFPQRELFGPLGIHRGVIETDPSGTFVGSSYGYLTARDWATIGLLYANDGVFPPGQRILPAGWVARAATPVAASHGRYGSQLWLNVDPDGDGPARRAWPELPANLLRLDGHEGQSVIVLPDENLVCARLGCTKAGDNGVRRLLQRVLAACKG